MTPEQALDFLNKLIDFENTSFEYKKNLINRLVKKVTVFNDKIIVQLNDTDLNIPIILGENEGGAADGSTTSPSCPPLVNSGDS